MKFRVCFVSVFLAVFGVIYGHGIAIGATIETVVYPQYVDGRVDGNPFAVFVKITGWTAGVGKTDAGVIVTTESGTNYYIWNGTQWGSAYNWNNYLSIKDELDPNGNWEGWVFLKSRSASDQFKASARYRSDDTWSADVLEEDTPRTVNYLSSNELAVCYGIAGARAAGKVVAFYENESDTQPIGTYAIEDNGVSEIQGDDDCGDPAYPASPDVGYFRAVMPRNRNIRKIVAYEMNDTNTNGQPEVFDEDSVTEKGYFWTTGSAKSKDLEESGLKDVSLPVILGAVLATEENGIRRITWDTTSEVDIIGWNVYGKSDDDWVRLNDKLIPGSLDGHGRYVFIDRSERRFTEYMLESVNLDGTSERFEPVSLKSKGRVKITIWSKVKIE